MEAVSSVEELKYRVEATKRLLEARLASLRADARARARGETGQIEDSLAEVRRYLQDGWTNMSEAIAARLNEWLERNQPKGYR